MAKKTKSEHDQIPDTPDTPVIDAESPDDAILQMRSKQTGEERRIRQSAWTADETVLLNAGWELV